MTSVKPMDQAYPPPQYQSQPPGAAQYSQQYPSQQYGQQYGHSTVVVTQPVVPVVVRFHESPMRMKCTFCHADIVTATYYETGTLTWIVCVVLCFIGCNLGCCFIPFCVNACKDVVHKCPSCHQVLGKYNRL